MILLISNDPLAPRQRLAEPLKPPALGPAYLADLDHLVLGRGNIADASNGWLDLTDIATTECFWYWDDTETVLSYNPDGRKREAPERPHQRRFRERLMNAYGGRCAVTGCDVPELLDAAHLMPWRIADEGILLRTDLHRMIDRGLAEITDGRFRLLRRVSDYEQYDGAEVRKPERRGADCVEGRSAARADSMAFLIQSPGCARASCRRGWSTSSPAGARRDRAWCAIRW